MRHRDTVQNANSAAPAYPRLSRDAALTTCADKDLLATIICTPSQAKRMLSSTGIHTMLAVQTLCGIAAGSDFSMHNVDAYVLSPLATAQRCLVRAQRSLLSDRGCCASKAPVR